MAGRQKHAERSRKTHGLSLHAAAWHMKGNTKITQGAMMNPVVNRSNRRPFQAKRNREQKGAAAE